MVLIHSRATDFTTIKVIEWLVHHFKRDIHRINTILDLKSYLQYEYGANMSKLPFSSYYFHGGRLKFKPLPISGSDELNIQFSDRLYTDLASVANIVFNADNRYEHKCFGLTPLRGSQNNKLIALQIAQSLGMNIPPTQVVVTKRKLQELFDNSNGIITKSIADGANFKNEELLINGERTEVVMQEHIENAGDNFYPTLIQTNIKKEFEIRVFCFREQFYCLAIFPYDDNASIDYRNNNLKIPNREVPFELPNEVKMQIVELMNRMNLNFGCIDLIMGEDGQYYFLEINEFGQYGFVSKSGNYNLEKLIANFLVN